MEEVMGTGIYIEIADNPDELIHRAFLHLAQAAQEALERKDRFAIAISGGSTPRPLYKKMGAAPWSDEIPWQRTYIFGVDERCVPPEDPASNYGAARSDFLNRVPIPPGQIYPMPGERDPVEGAARYEDGLTGFFSLKPGAVPIFDFMLLGVGSDGHMASLFPGQDSLDERKRLIIPVTGGDPFVPRLTMTYPVINRTRYGVFLVSGKGKANILKAVLVQKDENLPARRVRPENGVLYWLMDRDAASKLPSEVLHEYS